MKYRHLKYVKPSGDKKGSLEKFNLRYFEVYQRLVSKSIKEISTKDSKRLAHQNKIALVRHDRRWSCKFFLLRIISEIVQPCSLMHSG